MSESKEIVQFIELEKLNPVEIFVQQKAETVIKEIQARARSIVLDPATDKGRKEIASIAHKIARTKTALDDMGAKQAEDVKRQVATIDGQRRFIRDSLDALKKEIRQPLDEYEAREEARVKAHKDALAQIEALGNVFGLTAVQLQGNIDAVAQIMSRQWEEYATLADATALKINDRLKDALEAARRYQEEQAELARLRADKEKRDREAREEKIRQEAADKAKAEAEEKAEAQRKAQEAEAQRLKDEAAAAERRAQEAEEARKKAEADAEAKAKAAAEKAAQDERDRAAAAQKAEEEAAAKREANKRHRAKINKEAAAALAEQSCISLNHANAAIEAIANGEIPHIVINY